MEEARSEKKSGKTQSVNCKSLGQAEDETEQSHHSEASWPPASCIMKHKQRWGPPQRNREAKQPQDMERAELILKLHETINSKKKRNYQLIRISTFPQRKKLTGESLRRPKYLNQVYLHYLYCESHVPNGIN